MSDPVASTADTELLARVEQVLSPTFELDREIGRGGMGIVYLARDRRLKRGVAIKVLPPELSFRSDIRSRFLREAETAAQLSHPNIVPIFTVDEREGLVFFVMAYIDGDTLARRLEGNARVPVPEARRLLTEVASALAYAHSRGVIHRDIKPDNILLSSDGGRAMVTDFGIARAISNTSGADSRLTATGVAIGTPTYMSPEQCAGDREVDGRSDLYSLGVVAYQMLSGDVPFRGTGTGALLVKHISEKPVPILERSDGGRRRAVARRDTGASGTDEHCSSNVRAPAVGGRFAVVGTRGGEVSEAVHPGRDRGRRVCALVAHRRGHWPVDPRADSVDVVSMEIRAALARWPRLA